MNLLVTLNSSYVKPLCVMLNSLMISNPNEKIDLYVAHSSLSKSDFKKIEKHIVKNRVKVHSIVVDDKLMADAPVLERISKETYYRLLLLDFLPPELDRILYIDPDTVIINSLKTLYNLPLNGKILAAAGHTYSWVEWLNRIRFKRKNGERYFNAGIILFNLEEMRKSVSTQEIFDYIEKNKKRLYLADQDVLNGMFGDRALIIDETLYNLDEKTVARYKLYDTDWIRQNTVIVHFNGQYKPWKEGYKGVLAHFYYENMSMYKVIHKKVG